MRGCFSWPGTTKDNRMNTEKHGKTTQTLGAQRHTGGCHCGAVRYEVTVDASRGGRCNCPICNKINQLGGMVKPDAFKLVTGGEIISLYEWGGQTSRRSFCKQCGVHCFGSGHLKELGGDFVSVNLNTLDGIDPDRMSVSYWEGRHDNLHAGTSDKPSLMTPRPSESAA